MKKEITHYYCFSISTKIKTKNKLQNHFKEFLMAMHSDLYLANEVEKVKLYIIEKAKELNKEYHRCTPLNISFKRYTEGGNFYLIGFDYCPLTLMSAHLIELSR